MAADLLGVDVPKGARDEMSAEQRETLEARLAAAGLDVRQGPSGPLRGMEG